MKAHVRFFYLFVGKMMFHSYLFVSNACDMILRKSFHDILCSFYAWTQIVVEVSLIKIDYCFINILSNYDIKCVEENNGRKGWWLMQNYSSCLTLWEINVCWAMKIEKFELHDDPMMETVTTKKRDWGFMGKWHHDGYNSLKIVMLHLRWIFYVIFMTMVNGCVGSL